MTGKESGYLHRHLAEVNGTELGRSSRARRGLPWRLLAGAIVLLAAVLAAAYALGACSFCLLPAVVL